MPNLEKRVEVLEDALADLKQQLLGLMEKHDILGQKAKELEQRLGMAEYTEKNRERRSRQVKVGR